MSAGNRCRVLTGEERVLWAHITKTIEPLRAGAHFDAGDKTITSAAPAPRAKTTVNVPQPSPAKPAVPPLAPPLAPLGRRMRTRVARGKEAIDARIDLHGLTQAQAHSALLHFLRDAQARDARLLLVITGKGSKNLGRGSEPGVLRRQVPQWLALPEFRSFVVGFEDAHIAHGGEGALYVRVRRTRSG
jgi:DNA-nicking Smr family endonuclease